MYHLILEHFTVDEVDSIDDESAYIINFDVSDKIMFPKKNKTRPTFLLMLSEIYYVLQLASWLLRLDLI